MLHLIFPGDLGGSYFENRESEGEGEGLGAAGTSSQCSGALSGSTAGDAGHPIGCCLLYTSDAADE